MNILTLPRQTWIHSNQPLQFSLPPESMEATGHVSASSVAQLMFPVFLWLAPLIVFKRQSRSIHRFFVFSAGLAQRRLSLDEPYTLALMFSHTFCCIRQSMNSSQKFHYA
jgi:hypothetical protein